MIPPEIQVWFDRVDALMTAGDVAGAIKLAEAAVSQHPKTATLWNLRGSLLAISGRTADGIEALEQAAALDPADPEPLRNVINLQLGLKAWPEARAAAARLLAVTPRDAQAHWMVGIAAAGAGAMETAAARFRVATRLEPGKVQAWLDLSTALRHLGRLNQAVDAVDEALALNPDEPQLAERRRLLIEMAARPSASLA